MKSIYCLNKIAPIGLDKLDRNEYKILNENDNPDAILVRSAVMHEMKFEENLLAIARAGAGVNNIRLTAARRRIVVSHPEQTPTA